jgi:prepilin-type N-terminal cleavage/methylation domain-containing protein
LRKKAFTLVEIIIVIFIISLVYFIVLPNFNVNKKEEKPKFTLEKIKNFMLKNYSFKHSLSFVCIDEQELPCYIFVDEELNEEFVVKNLFKTIPEVYNYDRELSSYEFTRVKINDMEYEPFFELRINSDRKYKNIVVDTLDDKVYLFSSINKEVKTYKNTNEILDEFYEKEVDIKDAL